MISREKVPYGYIYRATNVVNDKIYLGKTETKQWGEGKIPIEERWKREVKEAYYRKAREENLRYIENAVIKYGAENFELIQEDIAYSLEELNQKEREYIKKYDSTNPDKGYNMMEGGEGGKMNEMAKEKMSRSGTEKWRNDQEYRERHLKERQERAIKNPEWQQKMTEINQEIARNPKVQEKMSKVLTEKWQEQKYQESVSKGMKEKWKDEKFKEKQARAKVEGKREIQDKGQFLRDITEMKKKDMITKYDMDGKSINNRIEEMLKHQDVRTYSEAKKYLEDKNIKDVLKDIEERQGIEQKPDFREKMTEINRARAKDPEWLAKMREIGKQYRKEIPDKREFLKEIKENMPKKEMLQKYDMGGKALNRRVQEMLGPDGPKNYTELKEYMKERNVKDVLKEMEERAKESEPKPSSEKENSKEKEELKPQEKNKESPESDTKKKEKEGKTEAPKSEDKGTSPENGKEDVDKDIKQDIADDKSKGAKNGEEIAGEDFKPEEPDYAGIDEETSKEGGIEKKSDIGGIMETSSIRDSIDRNMINIKESKEKAPTRKDGEVPKLTSGIEVTGDPTAKRLAVPQMSTGEESKHPDLAGLNLNLHLNSVSSSELFSGGDGGGGGGGTPDYDGIDAITQETDEESETKGEDGSEGRESNYET